MNMIHFEYIPRFIILCEKIYYAIKTCSMSQDHFFDEYYFQN